MIGAAGQAGVEERLQPLGPGLREVDPLAADFANRLHRLVVAAPELRLLRGWQRRDEPRAAFADDRGLLWRPHRPPENFARCLDTQIEQLTDHETAIAAFERATGVDFAPASIVVDEACCAHWIEVSVGDSRSEFGFRPKVWEQVALRDPPGDVVPSRTPCPAALSLRAGAVPLAEVEKLSAGALLCLPAGPLAAALAVGALARSLAGAWNSESGAFVATAKSGAQGVTTSQPVAEPGGLNVPLTIRLPETPVPLAEIEALAEGGTITLAPLSEGLAAELLVGGQLIATGEIVRLGDAFAFLVDAMNVKPHGAAASVAGDAAPPVPGTGDEGQ